MSREKSVGRRAGGNESAGSWKCGCGSGSCKMRNLQEALEVGGEAKREAARGADGVAGEQAAEIDDVQDVGEVLSIDL